MTTSDEGCIICGHDSDWHVKNNTRHRFATKDQAGALAQLGPSNKERDMFPHRHANRQGVTQAERTKVTPGLLGDPVLRVLLLRKGIITADELSETDAEIRQAREEGGVVIITPNIVGSGGSDRPDSGLGDRNGS